MMSLYVIVYIAGEFLRIIATLPRDQQTAMNDELSWPNFCSITDPSHWASVRDNRLAKIITSNATVELDQLWKHKNQLGLTTQCHR